MAQGMPELGSKISLISKADIRYEGRLFTVDPQECTIALASVRSFGTENRETQFPVAPQNQVYDYILFRGSDIKDIRVVNNVQTLPNDPAIMQLSVPPTLGQHQFPTAGFSHPVLGSMTGAPMGQFNNAYGMGPMGNVPGGMAPGMGLEQDPRLSGGKPSELILPGPAPPNDIPPAIQPTSRPAEDASVLDIIGGSRSNTPASLSSRKSQGSPTNDQGVQVSGKKDDKKNIRPIQRPDQRNMHQQRDRRESQGENYQHNRNHQRPNNRNQNYNQHQNYNNQHQHYNNHNNHMNNRGQGGWVQRGQVRRGRPRGGGPFNPKQNPQAAPGAKAKNTLKFDNDYDFDKANTEFEEIRNQFSKVKIEDTKAEVNGESEKKEDSGNETGAGEGEQEEEVYYDKTKSFFDNISCEAVERSKGRSQRTDWRTERKLNSETFGVAAIKRGGFRGRGGYRGVGYRGGFRGGYRHPNQGQRRYNNQGQGHQNQGTPQNTPVNKTLAAPVPESAAAQS